MDASIIKIPDDMIGDSFDNGYAACAVRFGFANVREAIVAYGSVEAFRKDCDGFMENGFGVAG